MEKPIKITQDKEFPQMYRLEWENGDLSEDFYNLTRANEILRNYGFYHENAKKQDRKKIKRLSQPV